MAKHLKNITLEFTFRFTYVMRYNIVLLPKK